MDNALKILPTGTLDFLSLGALIHRLDPGPVPFRKAMSCAIHVSGGEFNTAANLSDCFGLRTGIATAMVDYPIGDLIAGRVRGMGVTPFYKMFKHDGAWGPNMAAVYSDRGYGVRGPVVFYNRSNEAAAQLKPGDFDWAGIFGSGIRWFHSGGIFASLSETTAELIIEAMEAARRHGAVVSFDLNYREKLWAASGGHKRAVSVLGRIVEHVDVLVGNEEDLQKGLGIAGPEVASTSKLDPSAFFGMIEAVVARYPRIKSSRRRCARSTRPAATAGARWRGSTATPRSRRRASWTSTTAWAAATASRPGSSTGCSAAKRPTTPSGSAGLTARSSRPSPATPRWRRWTRCARSRKAGRRGSRGRHGSPRVGSSLPRGFRL